jgi:hypothetical protein
VFYSVRSGLAKPTKPESSADHHSQPKRDRKPTKPFTEQVAHTVANFISLSCFAARAKLCYSSLPCQFSVWYVERRQEKRTREKREVKKKNDTVDRRKKQKREPKPMQQVDHKISSSSTSHVDPVMAQQLQLLQQRNAQLEAAVAAAHQVAVQGSNSDVLGNVNAANVGLNSRFPIIPGSGAGGGGGGGPGGGGSGSLEKTLAANLRAQALDILRAALI